MMDSFVWYVWMQLIGLGGWLVASRWLQRLPDAGYGVSKALGMLLGAYVYWISVIAGVAQNQTAPLLAVFALFAVGAWLQRDKILRGEFGALLPWRAVDKRYLIAAEIVFALSFAAMAIYRAYSPNIESAGGEKYMEMMMMNAILRSPSFPPNDAWLSGFSISYYYFGYVMHAMLMRLSGVAPAVGFNLAMAGTFALTMLGAFSLGYNLWRAHAADTAKRAIIAGLLTAIMLAVMGNIGAFLEAGRCAQILPQSFWSWLDVREIANSKVECTGLRPARFLWWWDWSRVVHDYTPSGGDQEVITESPAFSFVLGDNHPHVMNLPYVLLALAVALHVWRAPDSPRSESPTSRRAQLVRALSPPHEFALTTLLIGGLAFMNSWDVPIYASIVFVAFAVAQRRIDVVLVARIALIAIVAYVLYLPFFAAFASQAKGIGLNIFNGTRFVQFFVFFAPLLICLVTFVLLQIGRDAKPILRQALVWMLALLLVFVLFGAMLSIASPQVRAVWAELNQSGSVMGVTADMARARLLQRLTDPWVPLVLLACVAIGISIFWRDLVRASSAILSSIEIRHYVLLLFVLGALVTCSVEFVFLLDNFGTRMNSVFKFYYQAWTVWSVASAFAVMYFIHSKSVLPRAIALVALFFIAAGMMYPLEAAFTRADDFKPKPTLDGFAYLRQYHADDAKAIDWLNTNVRGAPVIAEAPGDKYASYHYEGRVSAFTGLPTLLGWGGHENQWRGDYNEPARREPLIEDFFQTQDIALKKRIAQQFKIAYVFIGEAERSRYAPEGLDAFGAIGKSVFRAGNTAIYQLMP